MQSAFQKPQRQIESRNSKSLFWVQSVLMESSHIDPSDMMLSLARLLRGYSHGRLSSLVPITRGSLHLIFNPQMPSSLYNTPVLKLTPIWAVSQRLYPSPDQRDKDWADWRSDTGAESSQVKKSSVSERIMGDGYLGRWPAGCVFVIVFEECVGWI